MLYPAAPSLPMSPAAGLSLLPVSYCANVGQQGEDYEAITKKAKDCGASKVYIEDLCEEFVTDFVFEAVKANAQYEGRYLLGTRRVGVESPPAAREGDRSIDRSIDAGSRSVHRFLSASPLLL